MQRFGSKVNNFWEPGFEPESDKTAFKPKDVDKESLIDFVIFVEHTSSLEALGFKF